jgi:hypothetical protein
MLPEIFGRHAMADDTDLTGFYSPWVLISKAWQPGEKPPSRSSLENLPGVCIFDDLIVILINNPPLQYPGEVFSGES